MAGGRIYFSTRRNFYKGDKMSEMIIIQCDYKDGECNERFEGFGLNTTDSYREQYLIKSGWFVQDDRHFCPLHEQGKF